MNFNLLRKPEPLAYLRQVDERQEAGVEQGQHADHALERKESPYSRIRPNEHFVIKNYFHVIMAQILCN